MPKKYYWMKLKEDFFEDDTMEWLEDQPNGKEYALFYLKLCLKALKTDGILIRTVGNMLIPYDAKKLAEITRTDFDTAVVAMEVFQRIGLIEILDNGEIYVSSLKNMVGSETSKAASMRRLREERREEREGNIVTPALPNCYTEKEIEIEKEKNKKETVGAADRPTPKRFTPPTLEEVQAYCRERNNRVDAERFIDFYAAKGWMIGKNKMKDWKASVRTWERQNKQDAEGSEGQRVAHGQGAAAENAALLERRRLMMGG